MLSKHRVRPRINGTRVMVVGEAPGETEEERLLTFVGSSGIELDRMLAEAGIPTSQCYYTNVLKYRPQDNDIDVAFYSTKTEAKKADVDERNGRYPRPEMMQALRDLQDEIREVAPELIIAVGNIALWALYGEEGVTYWQGSMLNEKLSGHNIPLVPVIHPASILRDWSQRWIAVKALKRAKQVLEDGIQLPQTDFIVRPSIDQAVEVLTKLIAAPQPIAVDIETANKQTTCIGFAWSESQAICIPLALPDGTSYWSEDEECIVLDLMRQIIESPAHEIIGQNFSYDGQYLIRRHQIVPHLAWDTMYAQHILLPGTPKDLVTLSLLYCRHHKYWKDDSKEFDPRYHQIEQLWSYNCTDCCKTLEVARVQKALIKKHNLEPQMQFLLDCHPIVEGMTVRGVLISKQAQSASVLEMVDALYEREVFIYNASDGVLNPKSPKSMQQYFYEDLKMPVQRHRRTKRPTTDDEALKALAEKSPLLWPLVDAINEYRSLSTFNKNFAQAPLDADGRMRCSYNLGGPETYRLSSSRSPFGTGTNLQNVPSGNRTTTMKMPNMRKLFIPDPGFVICEVDLAGADAQVVAWEAEDLELMDAFRSGVKIHTVNSKTIFGGDAGPDGKKEPYYTLAKMGVHLSNYGGRPKTMAGALGITVAEAEKFQKRWFSAHPQILRWHRRIESELATSRSVCNKFGFRRIYFDRIESVFTQALAWVPQSTVAIAINRGLLQASRFAPTRFIPLLQVHDSLVFQVAFNGHRQFLKELHPHLLCTIPYPQPLTIQLGLKLSERSWGDCQEIKWSEL